MSEDIFSKIKKQNGEKFAQVLRTENVLDLPNIEHIVKYAGNTEADAKTIAKHLGLLKKRATIAALKVLNVFFELDTIPHGYVSINNQIIKYNYGLNNVYFGDNFYAKHEKIYEIDKNSQVMMDYFIWDTKQKKLLDPSQTKDGFIDAFNAEIADKKVTVKGRAPNQSIYANNIEIVRIENGNIVAVNFPNINTIRNQFLEYNHTLQTLNLPKVTTIGNDFLYNNNTLQTLNLPKVTTIGHYFLYNNNTLQTLSLPNVKTIENDFLYENNTLQTLNLPKVTTLGAVFLSNNDTLQTLNLPNVERIGSYCLSANKTLQTVNLPKVEFIGGYFLSSNNKLQTLNLPKVKTIGDYFLDRNNTLQTLSLPNVITIGDRFLFENHHLSHLELPNATRTSKFRVYTDSNGGYRLKELIKNDIKRGIKKVKNKIQQQSIQKANNTHDL